MNHDTVVAITKTYRVYELLDDECKAKIPQKFVDFLNLYRDPFVGNTVTNLIPLDMQDLSADTFNLVAYMFDFIIGSKEHDKTST